MNWDRIKANGNIRRRPRNINKRKHTPKLKAINRSLRYALDLANRETKAEIAMKEILNSARIEYSFQKPIYGQDNSFRIVDFAIPRPHSTLLIVEVDGAYHFTAAQIQKDKERESWLRKNTGCTILRFENQVVLKDKNFVLSHIKAMINSS